MLHVLHESWTRLDQGISVIPCLPQSKVPAIEWAVFQQRRATHGEVTQWFGFLNQTRFNIGAVMGQVSLLVGLDADSDKKADELRRELPWTPAESRTARGAHFLYRIKKGQKIPTRIRLAGQPVDVKAEGSYIVLPPSIHPSGKQYEWVNPDWNLCDVPLFDPSWIEPIPDPVRPVVQPPSILTPTAIRVRNYIAKIFAISGQGGHSATFRAACKLRDAGLNEAEALDALISWNGTNAQPPWSERELVHKVTSAYERRSIKSE